MPTLSPGTTTSLDTIRNTVHAITRHRTPNGLVMRLVTLACATMIPPQSQHHSGHIAVNSCYVFWFETALVNNVVCRKPFAHLQPDKPKHNFKVDTTSAASSTPVSQSSGLLEPFEVTFDSKVATQPYIIRT